jgi:hypothetical protein
MGYTCRSESGRSENIKPTAIDQVPMQTYVYDYLAYFVTFRSIKCFCKSSTSCRGKQTIASYDTMHQPQPPRLSSSFRSSFLTVCFSSKTTVMIFRFPALGFELGLRGFSELPLDPGNGRMGTKTWIHRVCGTFWAKHTVSVTSKNLLVILNFHMDRLYSRGV